MMIHLKKYFWIMVLVFINPTLLFAQSAAQQQEINQINADIDKSYRTLAENYAYIQVYDFFKGRISFIHQANEQCINVVEKVSALAKQLSKPDIINQTYSSPEQAYAALSTLTDLMIYDQTIIRQIYALQDEFKLQKEHIKDTQGFLTILDQNIVEKFPRPKDLDQDYGYKNFLIKAYRETASEVSDQMKLYASKCGDSDLNFDSVLQKRTAYFSDFSKKLGDYYVENYTEQFMSHLKDLAKPSPDINLMLNVESVFNRLDQQYRDAALYEKDYLKSKSIIDSYESIAFVVFAKIVPLSLNNDQRAQAQAEINRRIQKAHDFKKILQKEMPSYWLNQRLELVQSKIDNKKINCDQVCSKNLSEVKQLVAASKLMERVSTDPIYVVLGNQVLDQIK